ncbi:DoxX family protein [Streptomyces sodiiphilus]|uniref:DoxX family protein n=1 Tax=Streptomyces sodiiphilus TaxID=226217 RepID=A0ABP5B477_9ACTN
MDVLVLIGRVLFAAFFLASAFNHLANTSAMAGYAESKGVPSPRPATLGSGVVLMVGSLSVLLGVWPDLGALLLFLFLFPTALLMHPFWKERDSGNRQAEALHFGKDMSLAGASLMLFAFFSYVGTDLGLTVTPPAFDIG